MPNIACPYDKCIFNNELRLCERDFVILNTPYQDTDDLVCESYKEGEDADD